MVTDLTDLGMSIQRSVALDKPYFRYVVFGQVKDNDKIYFKAKYSF
ncbi:MAG: hypothetical protein GTO16_03380 [Candidatus Aminicenantes bacterium]|nr:hypothetical protein [Candidatus Aminicenantes bacterium]